MSALVERIITARDRIKHLTRYGEDAVWRPATEAHEVLADAANRIVELERSLKIAEEKSHNEPARHRASFGMDE